VSARERKREREKEREREREREKKKKTKKKEEEEEESAVRKASTHVPWIRLAQQRSALLPTAASKEAIELLCFQHDCHLLLKRNTMPPRRHLLVRVS